MQNLFEAMPKGRNAVGGFKGKAGTAISKWLLSLVATMCLLGGVRARAEGDVVDCTEFALLTALEGGGLVTFDEDCSITLSGPIIITNDVTIDAGGFDVTLSGGSASQLFIVQPGASLELIGLTLSDGQGTNGGALFVDAAATATVTDCTFIQNTAAGVAGTNGVDGKASSGTGGNGTRGSNGGGAWGGAIFNAGDLTIDTSTFSTNSAAGGDGGDGGDGGAGGFQGGNGGNGGNAGIALGGAIFNAVTGTLSVKDCTFEDNKVSGGSGGLGGAGGSGSFSGLGGTGGAGAAGSGGGIYSLGDATIVNCTFDSNIGSGGNSQAAGMASSGNGNNGARGGDSQGGGVFTSGQNVVTNCTFFGNKVTGGNGGNGGPGNFTAGNGGAGGNGSGGGFYNSGDSDVVNCTLASCGAAGGTNGVAGVGAFPGSNGTPGRGRGGDIANGGGTFNLYNTILSTNSGGGNLTNISGTIAGNNNISSDSSYHFTGLSTNIAPKIGPLADNGGPTMTMALLANSPARDAGDDAAAPAFDQRNFERPLGAHSDIGAYEVGFTVSGKVFLGTNGLSGIKITAGNLSTTTDGSGSYQISALGSVTITPANTNYAFEPSSTNLNVGADITGVDFDATEKLSISGQVFGVNGPVSVSLGTNVITTTNGSYFFGGLSSGTFTITPNAPGIQFSPPSLTVTVGPSTNNLNFFALFQISGRVVDGTAGLAGVTVQSETNSAVTDAAGNYTLSNVRAGDYFISASRAGYIISPSQQEVTVGPSATNVNFSVTGRTYVLSGRVTFGTNGLAGVRIFGNQQTDSSGAYSLSLPTNVYTLTPNKSGYAFRPSSVTLDLTNDLANVNFVAGGLISSIVRSNDGSILLGIFGPAGSTRIQASTNLIDWVSIATNNGSFGFIDHAATNFSQRFYRTSQP